MGLSVDTSFSVRDIIEIVVLAGGGMATVAILKSSVGFMRKEMSTMQLEIKKIGEILTNLAVNTVRQDNTDRRVTLLEGEIRELRHGRGFVQGSRGIDHEYPPS